MIDNNGVATMQQQNYFQDDSKDWYINYAIGVPDFARHFQEELLKFKNYKNQNLLNAVCLAVAVYNNSKDLSHDISQTMFNHNFEVSRDECMGIICETINDFTSHDYTSKSINAIVDGALTNDVERAIRIALAICKNIPINKAESDADIHNFVGIVEVIARIV